MGQTKTRWSAIFEEHKLLVERNEFTRGFHVKWDGCVEAELPFTLDGTGELECSVELNGKKEPHAVRVVITSECAISVDGQTLEVTLEK